MSAAVKPRKQRRCRHVGRSIENKVLGGATHAVVVGRRCRREYGEQYFGSQRANCLKTTPADVATSAKLGGREKARWPAARVGKCNMPQKAKDMETVWTDSGRFGHGWDWSHWAAEEVALLGWSRLPPLLQSLLIRME